ncbi:hypothetical protein GCM10009798_06620 [Nocardioides panacihumi]|uniref:DUF4231 domain-containing protein n=1 Tax=Nocardioides panacihumi TaxID=400774 RepID=A0ABP5BPR0_9ACTN
MPLADGLPAEAKPLYDELARLFRGHSGGIDSLMYNWGTICSLLASGAAGVVATVEPLIASVLAALAAFFIAATRVLSFDGRWRWHLQRRARYASIIYRLNRGQLSSELEQRDLIRHLYAELEEERMRDGLLPGSGGSVETPARPATSIAAEA